MPLANGFEGIFQMANIARWQMSLRSNTGTPRVWRFGWLAFGESGLPRGYAILSRANLFRLLWLLMVLYGSAFQAKAQLYLNVIQYANVVVTPLGGSEYYIGYDLRYLLVDQVGNIVPGSPSVWIANLDLANQQNRDVFLAIKDHLTICAIDVESLNSITDPYVPFGFNFGTTREYVSNGSSTRFYREFVPTPIGITLTIQSANPSSGITIAVSPSDRNGQANGTTTFTRSYNKSLSENWDPDNNLQFPRVIRERHFFAEL